MLQLFGLVPRRKCFGHNLGEFLVGSSDDTDP